MKRQLSLPVSIGDRVASLSLRRTGRLAELPEKFLHERGPRPRDLACTTNARPRADPRSSFQGSPLVAENLQRKSGIQFRIVDASSLEPAVLIILDEVVIGMAWKREYDVTMVGSAIEESGGHFFVAKDRRPFGLALRRWRHVGGFIHVLTGG